MIPTARQPVAAVTPARGARPDGVQLRRALGAFRRRRRRVLAIRFLCTGLAVGIVTAEALSLLFGAGALYTLWLLAGAAAAAAIVSVLAAALRTPSLADTARLLDRHASLQNRAATALQFIENDDGMATLVVRDAARRMSGLDPAIVFPREYPARPRLLVAAVTVSALVFAASVSRVAWAPQGQSRSAGAAVPGGPAKAAQGLPGRQAETPGATPPRGSTLAAVPQGTQARADDRSTPQDPTVDREARADGRAGAPATSPSANQQGAGAGSPRRSATSTGGATASDRPGAGGSGAASPARDARAAAGAGDGAGQGGGVPGRATRAGGGIKGGALASAMPAVPSRRDTGRTQDYALEYQAAWARAQAALAQDRVPPPLREYVRRYFAAIRSPKEP
jgi:hypothetical protein